MSRQIGFNDQSPSASALEDRIHALEQRVEALNDAVTALRDQLASHRGRPQAIDSADRGVVRDRH